MGEASWEELASPGVLVAGLTDIARVDGAGFHGTGGTLTIHRYGGATVEAIFSVRFEQTLGPFGIVGRAGGASVPRHRPAPETEAPQDGCAPRRARVIASVREQALKRPFSLGSEVVGVLAHPERDQHRRTSHVDEDCGTVQRNGGVDLFAAPTCRSTPWQC